MRRFAVMMIFALCLPGLAAAADDDGRTLSVTGVGEVAGVPDMATVQIGVTHEDGEAAQAISRASEGAAAVLSRLTDAGVAARDVQTSSVSLNPIWSQNRNSDEPARITGFVATISVTARVRALDTLGTVLDAVVSDGANQLGGIRFGFQDPDPLMDEARKAAVADAAAKAALYAGAAGVSLGELRSLSEQGGVTPRAESMAMMARDAAVPIAPGEMSLSAQVYLVYEISD